MAPPANFNTPVPGIPYFTPQHRHSPGTPKTLTDDTPTLFRPLTIRDATLRNRFIVSPMCQYSCAHEGPEIGALTDWHVATLGHYAMKGAALVFVEATGVQPNGRISPNCPGLWQDAQIPGLQRVADFIHSQGALVGIQLAHAGRKASTAAPWLTAAGGPAAGGPTALKRADVAVGGWPADVKGPMGGPDETWDGPFDAATSKFWPPTALTADEIAAVTADFARAAARSVRAGVDVIEIHAAHGYLLHQFLSPVTNRRTDAYGGSPANRARLLFEVVDAVRAAIPAGMPLFVRLSADEFLAGTPVAAAAHGSFDLAATIAVARQLPAHGVDLLDVSSSANHPAQTQNGHNVKGCHAGLAAGIRQALQADGGGSSSSPSPPLLLGVAGVISEAAEARDLVQETKKNAPDNEVASPPPADAVLLARQLMREPEWVLKVAHELGVDVWWPSQFVRVSFDSVVG